MGTPEPQKTKRYGQEFKPQAVAMNPSAWLALRFPVARRGSCVPCTVTSGVKHEQSARLQIQ